MNTNQSLDNEFDRLISESTNDILNVSRCIGVSYETFKTALKEEYPDVEKPTFSQIHQFAIEYKYGYKDACISSLLDRFEVPQSKANPKSYHTYIMCDKNTGFYKIGKSANPRFRERTLQSEKPTIELLMVFKADIELNLHSRYERKRIRGEWFILTPDDLIDIHNDYKNFLLQKTNLKN